MQTRLILAVAISLFILMVFQQTYVPETPQEEQITLVEEEAPVRRESAVKEDPISEDKETRALLEGGDIIAEVSSFGAGFSRLDIQDKDGEMINLVRKDASPYPLSLRGFGEWKLSSSDGQITASVFGDGFELERKFGLTGERIITIDTLIRNTSDTGAEFSLRSGWTGGLGTTEELDKDNLRDHRLFIRLDGRMRKRLSDELYSGQIDLAGILNRYFTVIFLNTGGYVQKAEVTEASSGGMMNRGAETVFPGISFSGDIKLAAGEEKKITQEVYAGLKEYKYLQDIDEDLNELFSFGFFGFLSRFFLNILIGLYAFVGNYGIAIILLTLFLQIVMFPLNAKSFKSMKAMKDIQPLMTKLRKKYGSDPQRMNQEMMLLYKKYNVNPLGGCLPMLLQLPIFISLFTMLRSSAELRYSSFLWIGDLARADSLFASIPGFSSIPIIGTGGPLPLLMGGAMFLQQKMMGASEGPQKSMTYIMPILFTFMFMNFPAGLVLYWLSNSIFTFITQYSMSRKTG